jgi:hypothetical protein
MAGTKETSIRSYNFFGDTTLAGAGLFAENVMEFVDVDDQTPFIAHTILFSNDGATDLTFRFTADPGGGAAHGRVRAGETLQMDFRRERRVYLAGAPGLASRFWAW